jgi:hypothetical protein
MVRCRCLSFTLQAYALEITHIFLVKNVWEGRRYKKEEKTKGVMKRKEKKRRAVALNIGKRKSYDRHFKTSVLKTEERMSLKCCHSKYRRQ